VPCACVPEASVAPNSARALVTPQLQLLLCCTACGRRQRSACPSQAFRWYHTSQQVRHVRSMSGMVDHDAGHEQLTLYVGAWPASAVIHASQAGLLLGGIGAINAAMTNSTHNPSKLQLHVPYKMCDITFVNLSSSPCMLVHCRPPVSV
jgi:hypothetical protein